MSEHLTPHGVWMLSRRTLSSVGISVLISACGVRSQPIAALVRVVVTVVPPNNVEPVLASLRSAAPGLGFRYDQAPYHPELGYTFQMRRSDLEIVGVTPPKPVPLEVPMGEDGPELELEADEQALELGIFALRDDLTPQELRAVVTALTIVIEEVDGAEASVHYRRAE